MPSTFEESTVISVTFATPLFFILPHFRPYLLAGVFIWFRFYLDRVEICLDKYPKIKQMNLERKKRNTNGKKEEEKNEIWKCDPEQQQMTNDDSQQLINFDKLDKNQTK